VPYYFFLANIVVSVDLDMGTNGCEVIATFELPGVKKDDIKIEVHKGVLTISGEKKKHKEKLGNSFSIHERHYGKFVRSLDLPERSKVRTLCLKEEQCVLIYLKKLENIVASMEDGVLMLEFPNHEHDIAVGNVPIS
jgi:HSP20 family protein